MPIKQQQQEIGSYFVLSFSGAMLTSTEPFQQFRCKKDGVELILEPPRRLAAPTWRPIPQITSENFGVLFPGVEAPGLQRMVCLPGIDSDGNPSLIQVWGDEEENVAQVQEYRDTYPIIVLGPGHDGKGSQVAVDFLQNVFRWLRIWTRQWWIGRPAEFFAGNLHFAAPISAGMKINQSPWVHARGVSPLLDTKRVTWDLWKEACLKAKTSQNPAPLDNFKIDLHYYHHSGETQTAIILLCSIIEIERDAYLERLGLSIADLKVGSTDLLRHISVGFEARIGRNLQAEDPDTFEFVKSCWIARGHVAHGKPIVWIYKGKVRDRLDIDTGDFFGAFERTIAWFDDLPSTAED